VEPGFQFSLPHFPMVSEHCLPFSYSPCLLSPLHPRLSMFCIVLLFFLIPFHWSCCYWILAFFGFALLQHYHTTLEGFYKFCNTFDS
jgi:hypothetical protein